MVYRVFLCAYLTLCVSVFINFKADKTKDEGFFATFSFYSALLCLLLLTGVIFALLCVGINESGKEKPAKAALPRYATVWLGLKWNGAPNSSIYLIYFMGRRIVYAIIAVLLQDYIVT